MLDIVWILIERKEVFDGVIIFGELFYEFNFKVVVY